MKKQTRITIPVLLILMFTVVGCGLEEMRGLVGDMETLSELGLRQVESAVIPVAADGEEGKPSDLLILNRRLDPPPVEFYLSYRLQRRGQVGGPLGAQSGQRHYRRHRCNDADRQSPCLCDCRADRAGLETV